MGIYNDTVTLDFDTDKFGADINLPSSMAFQLIAQKQMVQDWQIEDINNQKPKTFYYKNPVLESVESCNVQVQYIKNLIISKSYVNMNVVNIQYTAANTANSIASFIGHTNRLSGLSDSSQHNTSPDFNTALSVGKQVINIANITDDISDKTPILGNFTSLYIKNDIDTIYPTIVTSNITIQNSIADNVIYLTDDQIDVINGTLLDLKELLDTRREHDIKFYNDSCNVVSQYHRTRRHSQVDDFDKDILNLIATDELKSRLNL